MIHTDRILVVENLMVCVLFGLIIAELVKSARER